MKSNKGITLTSLVIYIIGLMIVIGLISAFYNYFVKNMNQIVIKNNSDEQYTKFLSYITKDANSYNLKEVKTNVNDEDVLVLVFFDNTEHQYIHKNDKIFFLDIDENHITRKKIPLCRNVLNSNDMVFKYSDNQIMVNLNINNNQYINTLTVKTGN